LREAEAIALKERSHSVAQTRAIYRPLLSQPDALASGFTSYRVNRYRTPMARIFSTIPGFIRSIRPIRVPFNPIGLPSLPRPYRFFQTYKV
jgi:hypothetical protein